MKKKSQYSPENFHRQSIRLKGYDYSSPGYYFVTICTYHKKCLFGEVIEGQMKLNDHGTLVLKQWNRIPDHFRKIQLDEMVIMPNHIHGIINIIDVGAKHNNSDSCTKTNDIGSDASPLPKKRTPIGTKRNSLSSIIQNFKSITSRQFNRINGKSNVKLWQRNFYDHIIRNEESLNRIREYIIYNPLKWEFDKENPINWKNKS